jgi:quinol monooxygenase YgiN
MNQREDAAHGRVAEHGRQAVLLTRVGHDAVAYGTQQESLCHAGNDGFPSGLRGFQFSLDPRDSRNVRYPSVAPLADKEVFEEVSMSICQSGVYQVKPSAVTKVKTAIEEFVRYVRTSEPDTQMYLAWQEKDDPTKFVHLFIFADAEAHRRHGESEAVKRFEAVYSPELIGGPVVFTEYEMTAGKR